MNSFKGKLFLLRPLIALTLSFVLAACGNPFTMANKSLIDVGHHPGVAGLSLDTSATTVVSNLASLPADGSTSVQVTVTLLSSLGVPVGNKEVSLLSSRGTQDSISPAVATTNALGIAIFTVTSLHAGGPVVTAALEGIPLPAHASFNFLAGSASKLVFTAFPASSAAGSGLGISPTVQIQDANSNLTNDASLITLNAFSDASCTMAAATAPNSSPALVGTAAQAAIMGTSTFSSLQINRAGALYLKASDGVLTSACSGPITVTAGAFSLTQSVLAVSANTVASGSALTATLTAYDSFGNNNPSGISTLAFVATTTAGTGTFGSIRSLLQEFIPLLFTGGVIGATTLSSTINSSAVTGTQAVTVTAGGASRLAFQMSPPSSGVAGSALSSFSVNILDAGGNQTSDTSTVALAAYSDASCTTATATTPNGSNTVTGTASIAAVSGLASFSTVSANRAGAVYLKATSGALTPICSSLITVASGGVSLTDTTLSASASTIASGGTSTLTVTGKDAFGNPNPSGMSSVTFAKISGAGSGTFSATTSAGSGVYTAVFTGMSSGLVTIQSAQTAGTVTATTGVTIGAGSGTKLVFTQAPSASSTAGTTLATQPQVTIEDASSNPVASATDTVTLAAYSDASCTLALSTTPSGSAVLSGTLSLAASSGVASFSGIGAHFAGSVYLKASSGSLTSACSSAIAISAGAVSLSQTTLSSGSTVGAGSTLTVTVTSLDAYGNTNPTGTATPVFASSMVGGSGTLGSVTVVGSGVYTVPFTGVMAGLVSVSATMGGSALTHTQGITVTTASASKLAFTRAPSATNTAGNTLVVQPQISIEDSIGNVITAATDSVTLAAYSDAACTSAIPTTPNGANTLSNPLSVAAVSGVATFSGLGAHFAGSVYLKATSGSLTSDCSGIITVSAGAFSLADTTTTASASSVASGATVTITMTAKDAYGNSNATGVTTVAIAKSAGTGAGSFGSVTNLGSGVYTAVFTGTSAGLVTIQSVINSSSTVTSTTTVTVGSGTATKLVFTQQPASSSTAGVTLTTQPQVSVEDASSNVVTSDTSTVTVAAYSNSSCTVLATTTPNGASTLTGTLSVAATAGVTSFSGLKMNKDVAIYLKATDGGLTSDCSSAIYGAAGAVSNANTTLTSATTVNAGSAITVTVTSLDAYGNSNPSGTAGPVFSSTIVGGTGSFGSITAVGSGVYTASFTGQTAGLVTLSATMNGSAITATQNVTVTSGTATKLVFTQSPSATATAGGLLSTQPKVSVEDASSNVVTSDTSTITLAAYSDAGCTTAVATTPNGANTLSGTLGVAAASGISTFAGLKANRTSSVYLKATDGALTATCSSLITVSAGAVSLADTTLTSAATVASGSAITVTVTSLDAYGNANPSGTTSPVFSSSTTGGTGSFGSITAVGSGIYTASFTGQTVGSVTLSATLSGSSITATQNVTVGVGAASKLVFTRQPSATALAGSALSTQPQVSVKDASNNVVSSDTSSVTVAAYSDAGCTSSISTTANASSTLGGTLTVAAAPGVTTFAGLKANRAGAVYLKATDGVLASDCSSLITVSAGSVSLADTTVTSATTVASGSSITVTVTSLDAYGNTNPSGTATPAFASSMVGGSGTFGSVTVVGSGVFTVPFTGQVAGLVTLSATMGGSSITATQNVTVGSGSATKLIFTHAPSSTSTAGSVLTSQPQVSIEDASSNVVASDTSTVTLAAYSDASCTSVITLAPDGSTNTLTGTTAVAASSGVAAFTNAQLNRAGSVYLKATDGALTSACSSLATVSAGVVSTALSTFTLTPSSLTVGSASTLTFTALDAYANANPSGVSTLSFAKDSGAGTGTFSSATNGGSQVYTGTFTATGAGTLATKAILNGTDFATTRTITITAPAATKLAFTQQPSTSTTAGSTLITQPQVSIEDASSSVVTSSASTVTLSAYSDASCSTAIALAFDGSTNTLSGTNAVAATSGVVTFSGLALNRAGTIYLKASSGALTTDCSGSVAVTAGAVSLSVSTLAVSAPSVASGLAVTATLTAKDAFANPNPSGISTRNFSVASAGGSGTLSAITDVGSGVYTDSLTGVTAGNVTVSATLNGSSVTQTQTVTVTASTATKLVFTQAPTGTVAGTTLGTQPQVSIEDVNGNVVSSTTDSISLAAYSDASCTTAVALAPDGSTNTLSGTTAVAASSGVVTYSGLKLNRAGSLYLKATGGGYADTCSAVISISAAAVSTSVSTFTISSTTVLSGSFVNLTFTALDAFANPNPSGVTSVSFAKASGSGTGSLSSASNSGSQVYTGTLTGTLVGTYVIKTVLNTVDFTTTRTVTISAASATKLVFTGEPSSSATAGSAISAQPQVSIQDSSGNVATTATDTIAISSFSDSLCTTAATLAPNGSTSTVGGTASLAASAGVASFSNLQLNRAGTIYLKATSGSYASACSTGVAVAAGAVSTTVSTFAVASSTVASSSTDNLTFTALDAYANPNPSGVTSVSFAKASGTGTGTLSAATNGGSQVYTGTLTGTLAGSFVIKVVLNAVDFASTQTVTITYGPATQLVFSTQPGNGVTSSSISPQPVVTVEDANGNTVTGGSDATASIVITHSTGAGTMSGTSTLSASAGIATYTNLSFNTAGSHNLTATATLNSVGRNVISSSFTIGVAGTVTQLVWTTQMNSGSVHGTYTTQPVITAQDSTSATVTSFTGTVTIKPYTTNTCTTLAIQSFPKNEFLALLDAHEKFWKPLSFRLMNSYLAALYPSAQASGGCGGTLHQAGLTSCTQAAVNGVATFTIMNYAIAGTVYYQASITSPSVTSACIGPIVDN